MTCFKVNRRNQTLAMNLKKQDFREEIKHSVSSDSYSLAPGGCRRGSGPPAQQSLDTLKAKQKERLKLKNKHKMKHSKLISTTCLFCQTIVIEYVINTRTNT